MNESIPLPPYLAPLPQSDPQWAALNASAYEYAYGPNPGDGYLESFQIVIFLEMHHAYRVWGGPSSECGYWWVLAPPSDCVEVCPRVSTPDFQEIFAVCPEWNNMTNITVVNIPANATGVVGIGQSANCTDGLILQPSSSILQLNGNACASPDGYESCAARDHFLALSSCVNTCPGAILPTKTPEGVWECITGDGQYEVNATAVEDGLEENVGTEGSAVDDIEDNVESSVAPPTDSPSSSASLLTSNGNAMLIVLALLVARFAKK